MKRAAAESQDACLKIAHCPFSKQGGGACRTGVEASDRLRLTHSVGSPDLQLEGRFFVVAALGRSRTRSAQGWPQRRIAREVKPPARFLHAGAGTIEGCA